MPRIRAIPMGKGRAGLAAQRRQPIQVCNPQTDGSGVAKPGAKLTQIEASIAIPILAGTSLRGVLGIAKSIVYEFRMAGVPFLLQIGQILGKFIGPRADPPLYLPPGSGGDTEGGGKDGV